jgi:IMP dehydrogenase
MSKKFYSGFGNTVNYPEHGGALGLSYDDVLLVPNNTNIKKRAEVTTESQFGPYKLGIPIISAPMDTFSGPEMVIKLAELGAIGTLPRGDLQENLSYCKKFSKEDIPCVYCIGIKDGFKAAKEYYKNGAKVILIDVAHGGMKQVKTLAKEIKAKLKNVWLVAGNIVTSSQAKAYQDAGVNIARVGVGPGGLCTTRLVTGVGFPQLSAVFDTVETGIDVIADGGIRYYGDVAKALASGANMVMIGSMFAGTLETPGEIIDGNKKIVRGQASKSYMQDNNVNTGMHRSAEGVTKLVEAKGSVAEVIEGISGGLKSAMSYVGAKNLKELKEKAVFVQVSPIAVAESQPHIKGIQI